VGAAELIARVQRLQKLKKSVQGQTPTRPRFTDLPLLDFIPRISPRWKSPKHLEQVTEVLDDITLRGASHEFCFSLPPQHAKTETLLHGAARHIAKHPHLTNAYVSYAGDYAHSRSRLLREYAVRAGARLKNDSNSAQEWRTVEGGGLFATGIGGPLTGQPISGILIIDDPYKNRQEAESATYRNRVYDWFTSTGYVRVHPGASVIVLHTRWHEDDLIGRLTKEGIDADPWKYVNLPALNDGSDPRRAIDEPLWPEMRPLWWLLKRRARSEYDWASMFQGHPVPRGAKVFQNATLCERLPVPLVGRFGIGIDLAYSGKKRSDFSTIVVMCEIAGVLFVVESHCVQVRAPEFAALLSSVCNRYPGVMPRWYCSGVELGVADLISGGVPLKTAEAAVILASLPVPIDAQTTTADKLIRAQGLAADWNAGNVVVPSDKPWSNEFITQICSFTGVSDLHDDIVDAAVAARDSIREGAKFEYTPLRHNRSTRGR
jgi:hypothetical protein